MNDEFELIVQGETPPVIELGRAGLMIEDLTQRRLVGGLFGQFHLETFDLVADGVDRSTLSTFELLVVDEKGLETLQSIMAPMEKTDPVRPAVIALVYSTSTSVISRPEADYTLSLPQTPATLLAQLSVILYAHRGQVLRFRSAMDELLLNRKIFRSVTSGISIVNYSKPDMPLEYVNPAFELMTGYTWEEVHGRNCRFLQGDDRQQPARETLRDAVRSGKVATILLRNYRKDGKPFWNELSLSPIRNRAGEITHIVGIQNDVTARVEFEAALRQSEKLAAVGRLAASIAHEINNPLESVMNLLYLAETTDDFPTVQKYVAQADVEVKRIALITTQSLRFYKQSSAPQQVQCRDLIDSVLDLYGPRLMQNYITMERRDLPSNPFFCLESEIRQVLSNLVRNAMDAMRADGGRLIVQSRASTNWASGQAGVRITVADTGTGIDEEARDHLFQAFHTTKGIRGTGLGLWISEGIVKRHGGVLRHRSRIAPAKSGTVFTLFLPYTSAV